MGEGGTSSDFFFFFGRTTGEPCDFCGDLGAFLEKDPRPEELRLRRPARPANGLFPCCTPSLAKFCKYKEEEMKLSVQKRYYTHLQI